MKDENDLLPNVQLPGYISVKEAAKRLGLADKTIYRYVDEEKLPAIRLASSPFVLVEEEAVNNYKRRSVGRQRVRIPAWRLPTGANLLYLTQIAVPLFPRQEDNFNKKLKEIHADGTHLLPGTVGRYIALSEENSANVQIVLIWRNAVMPAKEEREAAMEALREEFAGILDWATARSEYSRIVMNT